MAIFIEEERRGEGRWFGFSLISVILVIIGVAAYYLFFVSPEFIHTAIPAKLSPIDDLTKINFNPQDVISGDFFRSVRSLVPAQSSGVIGNVTPFGIF